MLLFTFLHRASLPDLEMALKHWLFVLHRPSHVDKVWSLEGANVLGDVRKMEVLPPVRREFLLKLRRKRLKITSNNNDAALLFYWVGRS